MPHVIELPPIVQTVGRGGVTTPHEFVEEPVHLVTVRDAGEAGVLARDAHAGMQHDRDQETRLALAEAEFGDGFDAVLEVQPNSSSANPPRRPPPPRLPPPDPPSRTLAPPYALKPE